MARFSAVSDDGSFTTSASSRRSDRFLRGLEQASRVTFVSHVHPDPDSLGSMLGLSYLVEYCLAKPTRITRDGMISRAENRSMVELLHFDLLPVEDAEWDDGEMIVMVDSQPNTGRHNFRDRAPLYAVIDHHDTPGDLDGVPFIDIRRRLGSTCSLEAHHEVAHLGGMLGMTHFVHPANHQMIVDERALQGLQDTLVIALRQAGISDLSE